MEKQYYREIFLFSFFPPRSPFFTDIVKKINASRNPNSNPDGWSPVSRLLTMRITALRITLRVQRSGRPTSHLKNCVSSLIKNEKLIILNEDELDWMDNHNIPSVHSTWEEWRILYPDVHHTAEELGKLKKLNNYKRRSELRAVHSGRMGRAQEEADAGRMGGVIQNIMGRRKGFKMEILVIDGVLSADSHKISAAITKFFEAWFARTDEEGDRDKKIAHIISTSNKDEWDNISREMSIPEHVSNRIWLGFSRRGLPDDAVSEGRQLSLMRPTRLEFGNYIKTLNPSSAGGMSGLTYLMVKLWPTEILDQAYNCLDETWLKFLRGFFCFYVVATSIASR